MKKQDNPLEAEFIERIKELRGAREKFSSELSSPSADAVQTLESLDTIIRDAEAFLTSPAHEDFLDTERGQVLAREMEEVIGRLSTGHAKLEAKAMLVSMEGHAREFKGKLDVLLAPPGAEKRNLAKQESQLKAFQKEYQAFLKDQFYRDFKKQYPAIAGKFEKWIENKIIPHQRELDLQDQLDFIKLMDILDAPDKLPVKALAGYEISSYHENEMSREKTALIEKIDGMLKILEDQYKIDIDKKFPKFRSNLESLKTDKDLTAQQSVKNLSQMLDILTEQSKLKRSETSLSKEITTLLSEAQELKENQVVVLGGAMSLGSDISADKSRLRNLMNADLSTENRVQRLGEMRDKLMDQQALQLMREVEGLLQKGYAPKDSSLEAAKKQFREIKAATTEGGGATPIAKARQSLLQLRKVLTPPVEHMASAEKSTRSRNPIRLMKERRDSKNPERASVKPDNPLSLTKQRKDDAKKTGSAPGKSDSQISESAVRSSTGSIKKG